jgi:hypothetical protein
MTLTGAARFGQLALSASPFLKRWKEASTSFLKKRSKKLLLTAGCGAVVAKARRTKSFLVLFFKKELLSSSLKIAHIF